MRISHLYHLDSLRSELRDSLCSSFDNGRVVASTQASVSRDEDQRDTFHVSNFQDGQLKILPNYRVQYRLEGLYNKKNTTVSV